MQRESFVVKGVEFRLLPVDPSKTPEDNIQGGAAGKNDVELLKKNMSQFPELPVDTVLLTGARHLLSFTFFKREEEACADWREDPRGWKFCIGRASDIMASAPANVFLIVR